ncbi:MAG TPA: ABC transporter permease [Actinomycetes bacterium]|nr:ABC transporter permease [Actinomycetes bacterium]
MSTTVATASRPTVATRPPSALRIGLSRGLLELKMFFRERDAVVFMFALPPTLLALLGTIFTESFQGTGVSASQVFAASMIAGGIASTTFVNLGIWIAAERDDGTLRRLRSVPMPPSAYLIGKIVLVVVTSVAEVAVLLAVGVGFFDLQLPATAQRWFTFGWVFVLATISCSLLGIAVSNLARSARSAPAVVNLPFLVLEFISGVFIIPITVLPNLLLSVGALFPLKWAAQGFRSAFLPDSMTVHEAAGAWEHGRIALILGAWCLGGLLLCLKTFRWRGRRDR